MCSVGEIGSQPPISEIALLHQINHSTQPTGHVISTDRKVKEGKQIKEEETMSISHCNVRKPPFSVLQ
jgi:hypothetical protein